MRKQLAIVALILVTLLSSCLVRKTIQVQFDIPLTKQLVPLKSGLSTWSSCYVSEEVALNHHSLDYECSHDLTLIKTSSSYSLWQELPKKISQNGLLENHSISKKTRIYILYKRMKYWI